MSPCNPLEATAVVALTKWLLLCGTPASSISIITPYKGQKTEIISLLRKEKCIPSFYRDQSGRVGSSNDNTITVSTVDRYQGDENDIVILSLVRTKPGNRFVGLKNRFIVAVSRARLGFYIIGAVEAVVKSGNHASNPSHWVRFIASLRGTGGKELIRRKSAVSSSHVIQALKSDTDLQNDDHEVDSFWRDVDESSNKIDDEEDALDNGEEEEDDENVESIIVPPDSDYIGERLGQGIPISCPRHRNFVKQFVVSSNNFPRFII
jgi:hypothetical protein